MTSARLAAARALVSLERGRNTLAAEIEQARVEISDPRDTALLMELASGVTRWRAALDARIAPHLRHPLDTMAPEVRTTLRLAVYQLHHLDRVPDHAIVNEAVELTRALGQPRAAGFVNAVLRNIIRTRGKSDPLPRQPPNAGNREATLTYLSTALSHPRWLVARWLDRVGFDGCERWCRFNNTPPDVTLRAVGIDSQTLIAQLQQEGIEAVPGQFVTSAVRIPAGSLGKLSAEIRQRVLVQDEGSQLVASVTGATPGERVLDVCAAPGGKTIVLAAALGPTGLLVAADRRPARVALLRSTLAHAAVHAPLLALDASTGLPFAGSFDRILLDAPCSGLGTIRRDPDIKWNRQESDLARFASAQRAMIAHAADAVRPGGSLIYSTCSSEPEENEQVVDAFLASNPAFSLAALVPGADCPAAADVLDSRGRLRTRPHEHGLDAFFAARLVRHEPA